MYPHEDNLRKLRGHKDEPILAVANILRII